MRVLVVNAGSSSLKLRVLDADEAVVGSADLDAPAGRLDATAVRAALDGFGPVDAVGHRVVHGGTVFAGPVRIDRLVIDRLRALVDLAPLHQPKSLAAIDLVGRTLPDVPAVASFDTAFHATIPAAASTYAIPEEWRERWALRRYGFHGLSHAYAAARATTFLGEAVIRPRIVTCHLGAGASLAAVLDGHSVDTTMGFTPLEGLVMATRSGTVDPGLVLWLEEHVGLPPAELAATLEHRSGLLGLAGTEDMRAILSADAAGDERSNLAVEVYLHRLRAGIAAMTSALGGLDALVFTGGVGENAPAIRERALAGLEYLGLSIDAARNTAGGADHPIGRAQGPVAVYVVAAREDLQIAREVRAVLAA